MMTFVTEAFGALELKDIVDGAYKAETYGDVYPLNDGESFARLSSDGKRVVKYSFKTGQETGTLFDVATARGADLKRIDGFILSPTENRMLVETETERVYRRSKKAEYYIFSFQNNKLEPLSKNGKQQEPLFSPDGEQVAFVRENNLFLVKLLFNNAESQVTNDGKQNEILNGIPDWVNEEEFSFSRAFDFSADGKMLAWIRYDESKVPLYDLTLYKGLEPAKEQYAEYPGRYSYKYPVAGGTNSTVGVYSYDIKSHVTRRMDLPLGADGYVPRIKFTSNPDQLLVVTLNRHQNEMNIYTCNTRSKICRLSMSEKDEKYVKESAYEQLKLYGDHFVLMSDRSGTRQLYWYSLNGQLQKQLTAGQQEVTRFYGYNEKTGTFYYQAKDGGPLRTAVFRTNLKGQTKKLSTRAGTNDAVFSKNFAHFINIYSNLTTPYVTTLCDQNGKTEKTLIDNAALQQKLKSAGLAQKELFSFKTSQGVELNGWMMKPQNFDASKRYPVIMYQYSGPGSQQVEDSWGVGFTAGGLLESYWCGQGFVVVCVDGRGTGGRGAEFEKCTYLNLGKLEARDQVETAKYLAGLNFVDKDRIGIWGWSYGGFNTLMSMSEGTPVFRAGVAVAPPTDYRFYDTVYTERYMRTPGENPDGYDYNAISRAKNLNGALLICHGLADDNVHFQNTAEYSEALVQAGKQFQMQVYTNRNHSIYGGNTRLHLLTRITEFFQDKMK